MWRNILLLILLCCFYGTTSTFAQKVDDDIIKIKNGPTIYGGLDSIRRDTVFFRVNGKIPVTYPISQIEEFKKDTKYNQSKNKVKNTEEPKNRYDNPFLVRSDSNNLYVSFTTGITFFRSISPEISVGYKLHQSFVPIASFDYTYFHNANGRFFGLTAGITGNFITNFNRPYYNIQFGYGANQTEQRDWPEVELIKQSGGLKMDIGFGVMRPILDANSLVLFGLNYGIQDASFTYWDNIWSGNSAFPERVMVLEKIRYNRLNFTLGIVF
jgi:hypothetical protein